MLGRLRAGRGERRVCGTRYAICFCALTLSALLPVGGAGAVEWQLIGARYQGMGGAGVAVVDDSLAMYWNPGALAFTTGWDAQLPVGASVSAEGNVMSEIDELNLLARDARSIVQKIGTGQRLTESERQTVLQLVARDIPLLRDDDEAFLPNAHAALTGRYKRFAFGVVGTGHSVIAPFFDPLNFGLSNAPTPDSRIADFVGAGSDRSGALTPAGQSLADLIADDFRDFTNTGLEQNQAEEFVFEAESAGLDTGSGGIRTGLRRSARTTASSATALVGNNVSGAAAVTLVTAETTFAYGHPFFDKVGVGGAIRYIYGNTFIDYTNFFEVSSVRELIKETIEFNNRADDHAYAIDLGLMVKPFDWLRFGVVARNLNEPGFSVNLSEAASEELARAGIVFEQFELEPQARFGAAIDVMPWWTVALDIDLTENEVEYVPGFESRLVSIGTEVRMSYGRLLLAVRGGAFMNVAQTEDRAPTLTAGLGFQLWNFSLDLTGGVATERDRFESIGTDDQIPIRVNFAAQLGYAVRF